MMNSDPLATLRDRLLYEKSQMADILELAIVSIDGQLLVSTSPDQFDHHALLKGVELVRLSKDLLSTFQVGELFQTFIRGTSGYLIISEINTATILIASTVSSVKLGLMLMDLKHAALELSRLLPPPETQLT